jgi:hypothetical protein
MISGVQIRASLTISEKLTHKELDLGSYYAFGQEKNLMFSNNS